MLETLSSVKKEVRAMDYMKIKIARKVAYSLWEYEMKLRNEDSNYLKGYSDHFRNVIEIHVNKKLTDKDYKTLLNLISEYGFIGNLDRLKDFLIEKLNHIAEEDEFVNKQIIEIDD
jgi:hypothetical protein